MCHANCFPDPSLAYRVEYAIYGLNTGGIQNSHVQQALDLL